MPATRLQKDSLGEIEVPAEACRGPQSERPRELLDPWQQAEGG